MIDTDPKTVAIICSSIFAGIGLLLNFRVTRNSNRIAVSTKLADLYKMLSDELLACVEMQRLVEKELKEAGVDACNEVVDKKIQSLKGLLQKNLNRQQEIKSETNYLNEAFTHLDKVDVGGLDAKIAYSYRMQITSEFKLSYAEKQISK